METFRIVAKVKYKEKFFYVLINKTCQVYFIKELEDGSIMYPNEDEFVELTNLLLKKQSLASLNFNKKYKVNPKVISKKGKLIPLFLAIALSSCSFPQDKNITYNDISISDRENEMDSNMELFQNALRVGSYKFHELYNYDKDELYRINSYVNSKDSMRVIECQNFEEFGKYINTKINPSYDDIENTIINNDNIDDKYKKWLIDGINNLKEAMPDLNLTVLNFNLNRLQLEEITKEELNEYNNEENLAGLFDAKTGKAYFINGSDDETNKFIIYHEVLGHGISEASFEHEIDERYNSNITGVELNLKKEKVSISTAMLVMEGINSQTNDNYRFAYIGQGLGEGLADQIAKYCLKNNKLQGHPYIEASEQLRIMCETVDLKLEDYISGGGAELLSKKMQLANVNNSLTYIYANDILVNAMKENSTDLISEKDTFQSNILSFFCDYADDRIKNGEDKEAIIQKCSSILFEGGDYIHSTINKEKIYYDDLANQLDVKSEELEEK